MIFFDGRSGSTLREWLGDALARSTSASFAIRRIRLARLDLLPRELQSIESLRVLLGRLDVETLAAPGAAHASASARTATLLDMAGSGRLLVRSAGLMSWDPDFSLLGDGAESSILLLGSHQFAREGPTEALPMACAIEDPAAIRAAALRFEELWERGHDTLEAVTDALCRSRSMGE